MGHVLTIGPVEAGAFKLSKVGGSGLVPELEEHLPNSVKSRSAVFAGVGRIIEPELDAHGEEFLLVLKK